jgi:hypothetical protein
MKRAIAAWTPEQRMAAVSIRSDDDRPGMSLEDVKRLADEPIQHMLPSLVRTEVPFLMSMNLTIFCQNDDLGFITSDRPCVWVDPVAATRPFPYNQPVLASPTIEITMPLSPHHSALLCWPQMDAYVNLDAGDVDRVNRRTHVCCHEHFIARRNISKAEWF